MQPFARTDQDGRTPDRIVIITTCMGRLEFLRRALPTWLANTTFDVVIVDYSCPDGTRDAIEQAGLGSRVAVVRRKALRHGGRNVFNLSRARNAGARAAGDGYLLFLDADTTLRPGFGSWVEEHVSREVVMAVLSPAWPLFGLLGVHAEAFREVGGYDEGFVGWGGEDVDMRIRLHLHGLRYAAFPKRLLDGIPHPDMLRTLHSVEKDFEKMKEITRIYLDRKLIRLTGRDAASWFCDRQAGCLATPPSGGREG